MTFWRNMDLENWRRKKGLGESWVRGSSREYNIMEFKEKNSFQRGNKQSVVSCEGELRKTTEEKPECMIRRWGGVRWGDADILRTKWTLKGGEKAIASR